MIDRFGNGTDNQEAISDRRIFKFPGHTDYLAQELEGDSLMFYE